MTWTPKELIAISASRLLADRKVVFAGVGMPLVAAVLAKTLHAPHLTIVLEGGIIGPRIIPGQLPVSTNEMRGARSPMMLTDITDVFLYAQRGFFDYGFLGTAQIDQYGNINTSRIGDPENPTVRLPGTGGANDIISACREVFVVTTHEPRRFVEKVDYITSPGHLKGATTRQEAGLLFGGPSHVITDLALMGFDDATKRMTLAALQPGVHPRDVQDNTGFELLTPHPPTHLPTPTAHEVELVRRLDPQGMFL